MCGVLCVSIFVYGCACVRAYFLGGIHERTKEGIFCIETRPNSSLQTEANDYTEVVIVSRNLANRTQVWAKDGQEKAKGKHR